MTSHPLRDWRNKEGSFADRDGAVVSQAELAEKVDVVPSQISQIETGHRCPSMGLAARLSRHTGIPIEAFAVFEEARTEAAE